MEIKKVIERINFLYHKSENEELSDEEKKEQKELREYYIGLTKNNLRAQLEGIAPSKSNKKA